MASLRSSISPSFIGRSDSAASVTKSSRNSVIAPLRDSSASARSRCFDAACACHSATETLTISASAAAEPAATGQR